MAGVFGWIAIGLLVGQRLLEAFKVKGVTALAAVAAGTLLISLLRAIPCLGALIGFVVGCAGLGAVVLTRFGTQTYPLPTRIPPTPPVPVEPDKIAAVEVKPEPEIEEVKPEAQEEGASED